MSLANTVMSQSLETRQKPPNRSVRIRSVRKVHFCRSEFYRSISRQFVERCPYSFPPSQTSACTRSACP